MYPLSAMVIVLCTFVCLSPDKVYGCGNNKNREQRVSCPCHPKNQPNSIGLNTTDCNAVRLNTKELLRLPCNDQNPFVCADNYGNLQIYSGETVTWEKAVKLCKQRNLHIQSTENIPNIDWPDNKMFWVGLSNDSELSNVIGPDSRTCQAIKTSSKELVHLLCSDHHPFICADNKGNYQIYSDENVAWEEAVKLCIQRNLHIQNGENISDVGLTGSSFFWVGDRHGMSYPMQSCTCTCEAIRLRTKELTKFPCSDEYPFICVDSRGNFQIYSEENVPFDGAVKLCAERNLHILRTDEIGNTVNWVANTPFWVQHTR